jgi:hypothetical protein
MNVMNVVGSSRVPIALAFACVLLTACAGAQLRPAPGAQLVPGHEDVAVAQSDGIRMTVDAAAWSGYPSTLEREVIPLKVTIENRSDKPLRVRYNEMVLRTSSGEQRTAIPPMQIEGTARVRSGSPIYVPRFYYSGFYVAPWYYPYYDPYYVGLRPWGYPWTFDRGYYDRYYPSWKVALPTRDMQEQAIPEGVIEPGGHISGFLYFPKLPGDTERVTFAADLVNGKNGSDFGELEVPFVSG